MSGTSIETTLEPWALSLRDVKARMRPLFTQARVAASADLFLDGLLGEERRKTGWMRAEAASDPGPWRQQAILGRGRWDADALRYIASGVSIGAFPTTRLWSRKSPPGRAAATTTTPGQTGSSPQPTPASKLRTVYPSLWTTQGSRNAPRLSARTDTI